MTNLKKLTEAAVFAAENGDKSHLNKLNTFIRGLVSGPETRKIYMELLGIKSAEEVLEIPTLKNMYITAIITELERVESKVQELRQMLDSVQTT